MYIRLGWEEGDRRMGVVLTRVIGLSVPICWCGYRYHFTNSFKRYVVPKRVYFILAKELLNFSEIISHSIH